MDERKAAGRTAEELLAEVERRMEGLKVERGFVRDWRPVDWDDEPRPCKADDRE